MTDNNSNINGNLELQNKDIINTDNSLDKQSINLPIEENQFELS